MCLEWTGWRMALAPSDWTFGLAPPWDSPPRAAFGVPAQTAARRPARLAWKVSRLGSVGPMRLEAIALGRASSAWAVSRQDVLDAGERPPPEPEPLGLRLPPPAGDTPQRPVEDGAGDLEGWTSPFLGDDHAWIIALHLRHDGSVRDPARPERPSRLRGLSMPRFRRCGRRAAAVGRTMDKGPAPAERRKQR